MSIEENKASELTPRFEITPTRALLDDAISVHLLYLQPGQRVTVQAQMVQAIPGKHAQMHSRTEFVADEQGTVDVGAVPKEAQDTQVAPMRVLWAMTPDSETKDFPLAGKGPLDPCTVTFTAEADGKVIATATLELLWASPDVVRTEVREQGLAGTFFRPAGTGRSPGVLMVSGSDGGVYERWAALLASRGYAVLALAYFNYEQLPRYLVEIRLEYFETALDWMQAQESVQGDRLAVMGRSRGGELALLLGATFPQIKAVVALVPSHVVWGVVSPDPQDHGRSAWTYQGKPVPSMSVMPDPELVKLVMIADPAVHTPRFALFLANTDIVRQAAIPVESIHGPVLLLSGEDDKLWPSAYMANQVMKRLAEHQHPYPDQHVSYQGCGHIAGIPHNMPVPPSRRMHAVAKVELEYGGTPEATAFAGWDSWQRVLEFLEKNLKKPE